MLVSILAVLILAVLVVLVLATRRPESFETWRETSIEAPPSAIFPEVAELRRSAAWNPFMKQDPNVKSTYEGDTGVGAVHRWSGNSRVGEGSATIEKLETDRLVLVRLEMVRPMKCSNHAEFLLVPEGSGTRVRWTLRGKNNLVSKIFGLFVDCDKMCGTQFELGLAELKSIVEAGARRRA